MQTLSHILFFYTVFYVQWLDKIVIADYTDPYERKIMESIGYSWNTSGNHWQKGEVLNHDTDEVNSLYEKKTSMSHDLEQIELIYKNNHDKLSDLDKAKHQLINAEFQLNKDKTELLYRDAIERTYTAKDVCGEPLPRISLCYLVSLPGYGLIHIDNLVRANKEKKDALNKSIAALKDKIKSIKSNITPLLMAKAKVSSKPFVYTPEMVKKANTALRASNTLVLNRFPGKMQIAGAGIGVLTAPESSMVAISRGAALFRVAKTGRLGPILCAVVLALEMSETNTQNYKMPGLDVPALFSYSANFMLEKDQALQPGTESVDLPVRGSLVINNDHLALKLMKTGDNLLKSVPVLHAVRDEASGLDHITVPTVAGTPSYTILINPAPIRSTTPSNTGDTAPVPTTPVHTGTVVKPVQNIVTTTLPVKDVPNLQDFIYWQPDASGTGVEPVYVILSDRRDLPGTVTGKGEPVGEKWLHKAGQELGAPIPKQIADKLRGRKFANFREFRKAFWKLVAADPELSKQFDAGNRENMANGNAPFTIAEEQVSGRGRYELHHVIPINGPDEGPVFDLDNIRVTTPKLHIEIHSKNVKGSRNVGN